MRAGIKVPDKEDKETIERARRDAEQGKSPSTQAGEFVREEIHHVRQGVHGARSVKQAIAIGLSEARRAGVKLQPPEKGKASNEVRRQAKMDLAKAGRRSKSSKRSQATFEALQRESKRTASHSALSAQARASSRSRGSADRHRASMKAVRTKGVEGRRRAAKKAAKTRSHTR